jgi:Flp pilus assembly protein TadD
MRKKIITVGTVAALAFWSVAAAGGRSRISADEVVAAEPLVAGDQTFRPVESSDILALSDEMRRFLDRHVNPGATDVFKLQQLIDAIMGTTTFGLEYDEVTRTAAETFRLQRGNCLAFSTMFVALARGAGLAADFQEVDIPPDWSMGKDVFILNRHVNVSVSLGAAGVHVVDFNIGDFKSTYEIETVSDRRAIAHFYNNLGVERMQADRVSDAVGYFRLAIREGDGAFSPAWTNLGSLYRRAGLFDYAEVAFLEALKADKRDEVAMSNLVAVYSKMGNESKAEVFRKKVREHRMRNPFYRFRLAREAFFARDYDTAIDHLKFATRKERHEHEFYFLLGLSYLMKGNEREARQWMVKAEKLAESGEEKERYSTKIETLRLTSDRVN